MKWTAIAAVSAAVLAGCAASPTDQALARRLAGLDAAGPVVCEGACKVEWERAQLWLTKHSRWKLQLATDVVLQTFNTSEYDPSFSFTATKEPRAGGYAISVSATCGNPLGCNPGPADVRRAFYHYVKTGQDALDGAAYMSAIR